MWSNMLASEVWLIQLSYQRGKQLLVLPQKFIYSMLLLWFVIWGVYQPVIVVVVHMIVFVVIYKQLKQFHVNTKLCQ